MGISVLIALVVAILSTLGADIYYDQLGKEMHWGQVFWSEFAWSLIWAFVVSVILYFV